MVLKYIKSINKLQNIKNKIITDFNNDLSTISDNLEKNTYEGKLVTYKENEAIRILFIVQSPSIWPSIKSVWKACQNNQSICAKVVLLSCEYEDRRLSFLSGGYDLLVSENVPFFQENSLSLENYQPHVVFIPLPYVDMLPKPFSIENIEKNGARIVYIPYGLEIGGGAFNTQYQFNLSIHQKAWRIYARSERHRKMFARYCTSGGGNVVVTGHPRFDLIYEMNKSVRISNSEITAKRKGRLTILWTPHFSVGSAPGWSTFEKYTDKILSEFDARQDMFLIVRPHPLLFNRLRELNQWSNEDEVDFKNRINDASNMLLDNSANYQDAFTHSNALMADAGSFLLEYLATGKPLLYLEDENGIGLNDDRDIVNILYRGSNEEAIVSFLDMLSNKQDPMKQDRLAKIPEYIYKIDGNVGTRIINDVVQSVKKRDDFSPTPLIKSEKHQKATHYWESSNNTYLADPTYYERQELEIIKLLSAYPKFSRGLDIGCGDGRFTCVLNEYIEEMIGIDISDDLLQKARNKTLGNSQYKIDWRKESLERITSCSTYPFVSCLGVLSGFIDNILFLNALSTLRTLVMPKGVLLMKDSLSLFYPKMTTGDHYTAIYRNVNDYLNAIKLQGFELKHKVLLGESKEQSLINILCLFERQSD